MKDLGHALSDQYIGMEMHEKRRGQSSIETPGRR
jgi:hypothetical protein